MLLPASPHARGFSLVEVMAAVVIIGILAAVAAPRLSAASRRANAPAQIVRVQSFLAAARNLARRTNRCVEVRRTDSATLAMTTFATCAATDSCPCRTSALADESATLSMTAGFPGDVRINEFVGNDAGVFTVGSHINEATIVFLADGSTPYTSEVQVPVRVPDEERGPSNTTLRIMPATGIVRLPTAGE